MDDKRLRILGELAKHTGKRVPAASIQHTQEYVPGIERFHNLTTGVYKPAWSEYALMPKSPLGIRRRVVFN